MGGEQKSTPPQANPIFEASGRRAVYWEIRDRGELIWKENTANSPGAFAMAVEKLAAILAEPTYDNRFDLFKDGVLVGSALT